MQASPYFAGARPQQHDGVALARLTRRKRARIAPSRDEDKPQEKLTAMEQQVVTLRRRHPDLLLLFECGYRMRMFADDAQHAASVLGIRVQRYRHFLQASVPVVRTMHHTRRLVRAGFKVGIVKQQESASAAQEGPLDRQVAEIYTRATVPLVDDDCESMEDREPSYQQERFILSIVEETLHAKPLFACQVHEMRDEHKRQAQMLLQQVRIGVFAHDPHAGESRFDEFEDGATCFVSMSAYWPSNITAVLAIDDKRTQLGKLLNIMKPVEFVLPSGRLSKYSEQTIAAYVAGQQQQHTASPHAFDSATKQPLIRVERIDNDWFGRELSASTFTTFFQSACQHYARFDRQPALPVLSRCCFSGMWQYLRSFGLESTLIAQDYVSCQASSMPGTASRCQIPVESHDDLDLFVNSTTGAVAGSLYSILNFTKTIMGGKKLRQWISSPLSAHDAIVERQDSVQCLAFGSTCAMSWSSSYRVVYEELVETIFPHCKSLWRSVQRIHIRKATPREVVSALNKFQRLEVSMQDLAKAFVDCSASCAIGETRRPKLLESLVQSYQSMSSELAACLKEINAESAKANDTEQAIVYRIKAKPSMDSQYKVILSDLEELSREFDAALEVYRQHFQAPDLQYCSFRQNAGTSINYLISVKRELLSQVPPGWLVVNSTKKLVRFHPREIVPLIMRQEFLEERKARLIQSAWIQYLGFVDGKIYITGTRCLDCLATLDALCSLATVAQVRPNYTRPSIIMPDQAGDTNQQVRRVLEIVDGRHPIIETLLDNASYMSNSVSMSTGKTDQDGACGALLAISGSNMSGKSSLLRMCALIVLMAQIGSFVPASYVHLSIFDAIYTRMCRRPVRTSGSVLRSSTIAGSLSLQDEMKAIGNIAQCASRNSLVLVDESGFGMDVPEAEAVTTGFFSFLVEQTGCLVLFASHMTSVIKHLAMQLKRACTAKQLTFESLSSDELCDSRVVAFHYALCDGIAPDSAAIHAGREAGIPSSVLHFALELLRVKTPKRIDSSH